MANPTQYYELIRRPLVTEKSTVLQDIRNQYTFEVARTANKSEVRKAVETLFEVKVVKVRVINMPGKFRRFLGRPGRTSPWKKAVVTLREGDRIEIV
ncbi:MAG: 50S ribosomal protein L23 [Planctomycetota bacterium]